MDQGSIPPSLPFRLLEAYGAPNTAPRPVPSPPGRDVPRVLNDVDTVELTAPRHPAPRSDGPQRLVAATVTVPVDFNAARTSTTADTLAMYRHPADKNAAATAVNIGRAFDAIG